MSRSADAWASMFVLPQNGEEREREVTYSAVAILLRAAQVVAWRAVAADVVGWSRRSSRSALDSCCASGIHCEV